MPWTVSSAGSTWTNTYNKRRLPERESLSFNGSTYNLDRVYDANGALASLTYPDTTVVTMAPNALGKATQVGSYASSVAYHPNGAIASFTYGNGIAHSLTQNVRGLPRQSTDAGVLNDVYDYDANGNVTAITDSQEGVSTRSMGYDDLDRLVSVSSPYGMFGNASYGYDGLDNLVSTTVTAGNGARTSTHTINPYTNRLDSISSSNGALSFGYGYDARGNIIQRGGQSYVFDIGNRMASAPGRAIYTYDGFGRRVLVAQANGIQRFQLYGQDGKLYYAVQTGGLPSTTKYVYLDNHLVAEVDSAAGTQYDHTDGLGTPVVWTSPARGILNRSRFEPYGYIAQGASATTGFTGHVQDIDTGLTYMQQRYYDPVAGRFLSVDPLVADTNTGSSFNRFGYANNNPFKFVDPDGRDPERRDQTYLEKLRGMEEARRRYRETRITKQRCAAQKCTNSEIGAATLEGIVSVFTGAGNGVRFVARGTGILGTAEQQKWREAGKRIDEFASRYLHDPEFKREVNQGARDLTGKVLDENANGAGKAYISGRVATGLITSLGPAAMLGDATRAVESGNGIVDSVIDGILGKRE
jgi:RHS repeat-associated protein